LPEDYEPITDNSLARYELEQRVKWNRITFGSFDDDERVPWYEGPIPAWAAHFKEDPLFQKDQRAGGVV